MSGASVYNTYRDYSPDIGRYIESDPIGLTGGINTYDYVGAYPVGYTDPEGLMGSRGIPSDHVPPACDGTWEQVGSYFLPILKTFFCKCRWVCKKCDGSYPGGVFDTYGFPGVQSGYDAKWVGRGSSAKQNLNYGDPTECYCTPPSKGKN